MTKAQRVTRFLGLGLAVGATVNAPLMLAAGSKVGAVLQAVALAVGVALFWASFAIRGPEEQDR